MESPPKKYLEPRRVQGREVSCSREQVAFFQAVKEYVTSGTYEDAEYRELKTCSENVSLNCIHGDSDWSKVKAYSYMLVCDEIWKIPESSGPRRKYGETAAERNARPLGY